MNRVRIGMLARWTSWSLSAAFLALLLLTFAACGGGGATVQQQRSPYPFFLNAPGTLRPLVTAGSALSYAISASPASAGSPPGVIAVTMSGIPAGLTVAPDSFSMDTANNVWSMPVTITASGSLQLGTYPISVTGTSQAGATQ